MKKFFNTPVLRRFVIAYAVISFASVSTACYLSPEPFCIKTPKTEAVAEMPVEACDNVPISGMYFHTDYVQEVCTVDFADGSDDESVYHLRYTDPDANLYNAEIHVDLETYQRVLRAIKCNEPIEGTLVLSADYETEVYTIVNECDAE